MNYSPGEAIAYKYKHRTLRDYLNKVIDNQTNTTLTEIHSNLKKILNQIKK